MIKMLRLKQFFKRTKVEEVFTPAVAANLKLNYIERKPLITQLNHFFQTAGKQIVVFGYSGSGKTTLITNELKRNKIEYIKTHCSQNTTFEELMLNVFDELDVVYKKSTNCKINSSISADYMKIKSSIGAEKVDVYERIVPPQLTKKKLATFLGEAKCYWIIEDLHKLNESNKRKVADALKEFIDIAIEYPNVKVICLGALNSSKNLIELDPNLTDRVADFNVPLMTDDEIKMLIENGFHILNLYISEKHKQRIISLSNNIASVAHQLCLNICHNLSYPNMSFFNVPTITDETIDCSIKDYINEKSGRFKSLLDRVLAIKKDRNLGRKILKLFIDVDFEGVYVDDIYKKFKTFPQDTIKGILDSLCTSKYDEAFRYDEDSEKLKLVNPFFQVYIKMYFQNESNMSKKKYGSNIWTRDYKEFIEALNMIVLNENSKFTIKID